jgi:ABC-2 type transport system permease protein
MTATGGAVYDRGYRPYEGKLGGRRASTAALFRTSVRRALGIRRSWRQKVPPFVLLGIVTLPAVIQVGLAYVTRDQPIGDVIEITTYRDYVGVSTALLVFVAVVGPDIICPDRRQRVLSLLFARPLTGIDYVMAKVGAMFAILFAFSFLPQVVLYVGNVLVSDSAIDYVSEHGDVVWKVPIAAALLALFYSSVGIALASLTTRRIIAGASFIGLFLVASGVAGTLAGPQNSFDDGQSAANLLNLLDIPLHIRDLVFLGHIEPDSPLGGVTNAGLYAVLVYLGVVGVSFAILVWRYRWTDR